MFLKLFLEVQFSFKRLILFNFSYFTDTSKLKNAMAMKLKRVGKKKLNT